MLKVCGAILHKNISQMKTIIATMLMASAIIFGCKAADVENLTLQGSQGKLHAELQKPANEKGKIPLVILCHGFTANCNTPLLTTIANDLQAAGIASLRFDFNGHGRSEGQFQDMTVPNEIEDLKMVVAWAKSQPWVKNVSLLGHSQGGVVASMTAGELGAKVIRSLVLMAPAAVLRDDALRGNTMGATYDPWNMTQDYVQLPFGGLKLGRKYIESAITLPIYETALKYTGPVLVIHGTYDRVVPYTYGERFHEGYRHSTLRLIPGEDHSFTTQTTEAAAEAAAWLTKQLIK